MVKPGDVYGLLTVTDTYTWRAGSTGVRSRVWLCSCSCGRTHWVLASNLHSGGTRSCGCARGSHIGDKLRTHGKRLSRVYKIWMSMRARCENSRAKSYAEYGGRGIRVAPEWLAFTAFYRDMGDPPPNTTLDRIDTLRGYEASNCRWATYEQQNQNRRVARRNKTGVSGIFFNTNTNRWVVTIGYGNKGHYLGTVTNLLDAAALRKSAELKHWLKK